MTRLVLLRHGQTDWNVEGRLQGCVDVPLSAVGRAQAGAAAAAMSATLRAEPHVVTSDLGRAASTADAVASACGVSAVRDDRLRERNFGAWEGTTEAERAAAQPQDVDRWYRGEAPLIAGFEHTDHLAARLVAAAGDAVRSAGGRDALIVGHGNALRVLLNALLGFELAARLLGGLDNVHWSELRAGAAGGWWLVRHNVSSD